VNSLSKALNTLRSKSVGKELVDYLARDAGSVNIVNNDKNNVNIGTRKLLSGMILIII